MEYKSTRETAKLWNVSPQRVVKFASEGRIKDAILVGKTWLIPADAEKPADKRFHTNKKTESEYHFPLFPYSGFTQTKAKSILSSEELNLYNYQHEYIRGNFESAVNGLIKILNETENPHLKIGALYYLICNTIMEHDYSGFINYYHQLIHTVDGITSYKKEAELIANDYTSFIEGTKKFVENFELDLSYSYHPEALPYIQVITTYEAMVKNLHSGVECQPEHFECACIYIESRNKYFSASCIHNYLALMYLINNNHQKCDFHLNRSIQLSEQINNNLACQIIMPFVKDKLKKILKENSSEILRKSIENGKKYMDGCVFITEKFKKSAVYLQLSEKELRWINYAASDFTNKEIARKENISESYVIKVFQKIYTKTGTSTKKELVDFYKNSLFNSGVAIE